jgi:hypothetical protein
MFVTGLVSLKPLHVVELFLLSPMQVAPLSQAHTSATNRRQYTANRRNIGTEKSGVGQLARIASDSSRGPRRSPQRGRKT